MLYFPEILVSTWGCCSRCSPASRRFVSRLHPVSRHSSLLDSWSWQIWWCTLAAGPPATRDRPRSRRCGCRTCRRRTSSVCRRWLWRRRWRGASTTGRLLLSVPRWERGTLENRRKTVTFDSDSGGFVRHCNGASSTDIRGTRVVFSEEQCLQIEERIIFISDYFFHTK